MKNDGCVAREYVKSRDLDAGLAIRNAIFTTSFMTREKWEKGEPRTASIAYDGGRAVGFIPLSFRPFTLAPGIRIRTVFENAVGTRAECRGRGVGSMMIEAAARFLRGRADALFVYRGGERTAGYRFYARTGHVDLHYIRRYEQSRPGGSMPDRVTVYSGARGFPAAGPGMLRLFEDTYGAYGGFPPRSATYWTQSAVAYNVLPQRLYRLCHRTGRELTGYAIAGIRRRRAGDPPRLNILEIAARDGDARIAARLIQGGAALAGSLGLDRLSADVGDRDPFGRLWEQLDFAPTPRYLNIMARPLQPRMLLRDVWLKNVRLPGVELRVWTPARDFYVKRSRARARRTVVCEMKEETLARWVMGRLDFRARVREGTVTLMGGDDGVVDTLARAIPCTDWVYHAFDYT